MEQIKCNQCGEIMKFIPAGISKKKKKPYKAFYACDACGYTFSAPEDIANKIEPKKNIIEERTEAKNKRITELHNDTKQNINWVSSMKGAIELTHHPVYMSLEDEKELKAKILELRDWIYQEYTQEQEPLEEEPPF